MIYDNSSVIVLHFVYIIGITYIYYVTIFFHGYKEIFNSACEANRNEILVKSCCKKNFFNLTAYWGDLGKV